MMKKNYSGRFAVWRANRFCSRRSALIKTRTRTPNGFVLVSMCGLIPVLLSAVALAYTALIRLSSLDEAQAACFTEALHRLEREPSEVREQKIVLPWVMQSASLNLNGPRILNERKFECGAEFTKQNGRRVYFLIPAKF